MKKYLMLIAVAVIMSFSACQEKEEQSNPQHELVGTYQFTSTLEGMYIMTENYWMIAGKIDFGSSTVDSIVDYENAYNSLVLEGGTWTVQDSIMTCTYLYDKDPSIIGTSYRLAYSFEGDNMFWDVLGDNDEVLAKGSCKKLE